MTALPAFGMEESTYPCDFCQEEKTKLDWWDHKYVGVECTHIYCEECSKKIISLEFPIQDKIWWNCFYCSYLYAQKNKQCWKITEYNGGRSGSADYACAQDIRKRYPNRILLDITNATPFPLHPNDPEHPFNLAKKNNLKWRLGITCVASVVCYGAYKAYTWWKSKDSQEQDTDDEQDWKKEEVKPEEQQL